jgi:hypothetical protein
MLYPIPFLNLGGKTKCDCPDLDFSREEGSWSTQILRRSPLFLSMWWQWFLWLSSSLYLLVSWEHWWEPLCCTSVGWLFAWDPGKVKSLRCHISTFPCILSGFHEANVFWFLIYQAILVTLQTLSTSFLRMQTNILYHHLIWLRFSQDVKLFPFCLSIS